MIKYLLKTGVDVNLRTKKNGLTPLHCVCAKFSETQHTTMKLLLRKGANPNIKDKYGATPLHYASYQGRLPSILDRADVADTWAPLAGPKLGWSDPDMIHVQNPPGKKKKKGGLTLGENRIYFGLWSIMKAPLLLSTDVWNLTKDVIDIISNPEVIAVNQDVACVVVVIIIKYATAANIEGSILIFIPFLCHDFTAIVSSSIHHRHHCCRHCCCSTFDMVSDGGHK